MRILDQNNMEMDPQDVDLEKGHLEPETIFKKHHEAVEEVPEQSHLYPMKVYFEDGTSVTLEEKDENVSPIDPDAGKFEYIDPDGRKVKGIDLKRVVDTEYQPAKEAYDETEEIQRYILYTEAELESIAEQKEIEQKREEFLSSGPTRLSNVEMSVDDMTLVMSDLIVAASAI